MAIKPACDINTALYFFKYRNLSREDAMGMLYMSLNDPRGIYTIAREISEDMLREIIFNASKMAWGVVIFSLISYLWSRSHDQDDCDTMLLVNTQDII